MMTRICTLMATLCLIGCELESRPRTNADEMIIINKAEYSEQGKVLYTVRAHNDDNWKSDWNSDWSSNATTIYFYTSDRSFDVGDKVKIVKK